MRISIQAVLLLGLLSLAQTKADSPPDDASTPAATDNIARCPDTYSYHAPTGWKLKTTNTGDVMACDMVGANDCVAMIFTSTMDRDSSLSEFAHAHLDMEKKVRSLVDAKFGELQPFTTTSGWEGLMYTETTTYNGRGDVLTHYFFPGHGDTKIMFDTTCHAEAADHYTPLFDAAVKTLVRE